MRAKNSPVTRKRHKKVLKAAKGYKYSRSRRFRSAKETVERAGVFAYRDRKVRKREFRKLWIARINAGVRQHGMTYSAFIHGLGKAGVEVNRKMLAELAVSDPTGFAQLVDVAKQA